MKIFKNKKFFENFNYNLEKYKHIKLKLIFFRKIKYKQINLRLVYELQILNK